MHGFTQQSPATGKKLFQQRTALWLWESEAVYLYKDWLDFNILSNFNLSLLELKTTSHILIPFLRLKKSSYFSYISFFHCFLSIFAGGIIFAISYKCKNPEKIPVTIVSKFVNFKLKYDFTKLMRSSFKEREENDFENKKQKIKQEMEEQDKTDW